MKIATCLVEVDTQEARSSEVEALGASWARFGEQVLFFAENSEWADVLGGAERSGLLLKEHPYDVPKENLHLVVQKGRLFQQEYPDVPVLLDKGRFLVVDLSPELANTFNRGDEPCYTIRPLSENMVAFKVRPKTAARRNPVAWIQNLVAQVSRSSLEANLAHLVSWSTRYSTSNSYSQASDWAKQQLEIMDYDTRLETIAVGSSTSQNVIVEQPGNHSGTRELVLVIAHLDSINEDGPNEIAPGADDNGSGSAGLLEIARVLKTHQNKHDLRFILVGGEEQGLFGSKQYVASLPTTERARIKAVLNMDMIGTVNNATPTVLLEGAPISQSLIDGLAEAAETYTGLTVQTSLHPYNSDHVPFIDVGIPAVLTIEGSDGANSNIHSAGDTLSHISYDLMLEILRMNIAFIANTVGQ
ncbi:MAG: M28 family metallopeptidase [Prochloraceae cyanobacterium]|nr:M28 family metallopeptidase [Prochloraceae cyanobacterium]